MPSDSVVDEESPSPGGAPSREGRASRRENAWVQPAAVIGILMVVLGVPAAVSQFRDLFSDSNVPRQSASGPPANPPPRAKRGRQLTPTRRLDRRQHKRVAPRGVFLVSVPRSMIARLLP